MTTNVTGHVESWAGPTARYSGANFSFVTSPVKNSAGSLRLNVTSGVAWLEPGSPPAGDDHRSFYFRFATLPATDIRLAWWGEVSGTDNDRGLSFNSATGKLRPFAHSTFDEQGADGGPVLSTGVWYLIDMAFFGATREFKWRMATEDEEPQDQTTFTWSASHSGGAIGFAEFGNLRGPTGTFDLYIGPSVETANITTRTPTYPVGHHGCVLLDPSGEGTHVNASSFTDDATNSPPVNPQTRIDDDPKTTTDTDWVKQTTLSATDYLEYTVENLPAEALSVLALLVGDGYSPEGSGLQTAKRVIHWVMDSVDRNLTGTGIYAGTGGAKFWDANLGNASYTPDPSIAGVNAMLLRHGYDNDLSPNTRIRDLWVEVAYKLSLDEGYFDLLLQ
jgi:hypothetical protein